MLAKNLKKIIIFSLILLLFSLFHNFSFVYADAGEDRTIYLSAAEYDYPPFSVTDSGEADGFSVDLLKAVAEEMGIVVTFKIDEWTVLKEELKNGELDILPLVGITPERDLVYDFTVPYIVMRGNIFVRKGETLITSEDDLFGKEVLVLDGDNSQEWAWSIGLDEELTPTSTYSEAFELLASGQYDAVLAQGLVGEKIIADNNFDNLEPVYIYENGGTSRLKLNLEGYEQKFCFAVVEGDAELLSILNEGLVIVSQNGTYDELYQKWFPFLIEQEEINPAEVLKYVMYILVPILIILITTYYITTKRTIKIKTEQIMSEKDLSQKYFNELLLSGKIFESSIENAPIPIMIHAEDGSVLHISQTWTKLTHYEKSEIPTIDDWTEKAYRTKKHLVQEFISKLYRFPTTQHINEFVVTTKDGRQLTWDFISQYIGTLPDGRAVAMSVATDVTERNERESKISFLSYHDALTGLHNRRYYEENLKIIDVPENYPLTIVMSDINGLKLINDAFGHIAGDQLLVSAANIIASYCRESDLLARVGGDEFIIAMPNTTGLEAEKIIEEINKNTKNIKIESIELSISFGFDTKVNSQEDIQDIYRSAEDKMYREKLIEIPSMRSGAIEAILKTLHEKDSKSEIHSRIVSEISEKIAIGIGLDRQEAHEVKTAGLLHDIGKIILPSEILTKNGRLTPEEYQVVKGHPEIGFRILNSTTNMRNISNIVLNHHERWDGHGYPRGIKGDAIPLQSRIVAIADAFDAMTSIRTYREVFTNEQAIEEIKKYSGTQFDPEISMYFVNNFDEIMPPALNTSQLKEQS